MLTVREFENEHQVKHLPIDLEYEGAKLRKIRGAHSYNEFTTISDYQLNIRNKKKRKYMAGDTHFIQRIDVDNIELFKTLFDSSNLYKNTPYYLSRNKKLPHFYIKLKNYDGTKKNIQIKHEGVVVCDILNGQWAWYNYNEKVENVDKDIIEFDFNDIKHLINNNDKTKESIKNTDVETKTQKYDVERIRKAVDNLSKDRLKNYEDWLNVGIALHSAEPEDEMFNIWNIWSSKSDSYDFSELHDKWKTFHKGDLTVASLFKWSKEDNIVIINDDPELSRILEDATTDHGVSVLFNYVFKKDIVTHGLGKSTQWYMFNKKTAMWEEVDKSYLFQNCFSTVLYDLLKKYHEELFKNCHDTNLNNNNKIFLKTFKQKIKVSCYIDCSSSLFNDPLFHEKINQNRDIICCGLYSYDLVKLKWRKTRQDDYCTIKSGCTMEEVEQSTHLGIVENILHSIFDDEQYEYMLNNMSEMLSGHNMKEVFHIWLGAGGNGKGLLVNMLNLMFGDYAGTISEKFVTSSRGSSSAASPELASIIYSRFVTVTEPEHDHKLNNSLLKELSGGDEMSTRHLFGNMIKFIPQFKMVIQCNNIQLQDTNDNSMARRVRYCSFNHIFVDKPSLSHHRKINRNYKKRDFLKKIKGSLMKLLINTWEKLSVNNFEYEIPECFILQQQELLNDADSVKSFITDSIEEAEDKIITLKDMYNHYISYMRYKNEKPMIQKEFKKRTSTLLVLKDNKMINKKRYKNVFLNCKLIDEDEENFID